MLSTDEKSTIIDNMERLLLDYDYDYSVYALEEIVDEWARQKGGLIEAFKKHPNYVEGKFMIAFDSNFERNIDVRASQDFSYWVRHTAMPALAENIPEAAKGSFHYGFNYHTYSFFECLEYYAARCISEENAKGFGLTFNELKFHAGQKTSRVVNKICQYLGIDKVEGYNREFAKYADSLSPLTIKRHTVLSINPLDYLTMSFGNSWASCHTIDKTNRRNMPNNYSGCYSSGTISYMLDHSSMVLYTIDAEYDGNEYWSEPKINRQMFHYGEEKLIQGRLYPQDNDRDSEGYRPYRNIVQQIISEIYGFPNLWALKKGTNAISPYVVSYGTHYRDYTNYNNCTISTVKGSENLAKVQIGASPICVNCGDRHMTSDNINCCKNGYVCADCGCSIHEDDVVWINGDPYCRGCVHYCEYCEEYHRGRETYIRNYGYVCSYCRDEHFFRCYECNEWIHEDTANYVQGEDEYVCDYCLSRHYHECAECGEYFAHADLQEHNGRPLCEDCYDDATEETEEVC